MDLVDVAQAFEILVEHGDFGFHASCDHRRAPADVAGAEHDDFGRADAGNATHQDAAPALVAFEEVSAHLRCEAAGDLTHWSEKGE